MNQLNETVITSNLIKNIPIKYNTIVVETNGK